MTSFSRRSGCMIANAQATTPPQSWPTRMNVFAPRCSASARTSATRCFIAYAARVRRERRAQTLGVGEGDLLVLAARDEEHRDGEPRGRLDGRGARDVVAEEEARPDARHPDERVLQEPEPCVELVAEQGQVGERRVRGGGADT